MTSVVDSIFGGDDGSDAAKDAAKIQAAAAREGIAFQREALGQVRGDLEPFRNFGASQLGSVSEGLESIRNLVFDPNEQRSFLQDNPFFNALTEDAERRIFNRAAASGRSLAGGTAEALQNSILLLGNDFLNQEIGRRTGAVQLGQDAVNTGLNAAAQTGAATQNSANAITSLTTQGANARAAGEIGAANSIAQGRQAFFNTGANILALGTLGLG